MCQLFIWSDEQFITICRNLCYLMLGHITTTFPPKGLLLSMYWPKKHRLNLNARKLLQRDTVSWGFRFLAWHLNLFSQQKKIETFEGWDSSIKKNLMNHKMRCFASICSSSTQSSVMISYAFCLNWPNNHICKMRYMRPEHAAIAHIFQGTPKKCLEKLRETSVNQAPCPVFCSQKLPGCLRKAVLQIPWAGELWLKGRR